MDERALKQEGSSARTRRRKMASAESRRFSRPTFPHARLEEAFRRFFFRKEQAEKLPKDRFDFFLTIVLTGSGRLPSDNSCPLTTCREGRSSAEAGLPPMAVQFATYLSFLQL